MLPSRNVTRRMSTAMMKAFEVSSANYLYKDNIANFQLQATQGQTITCKAAVAWEAKKPLDVTDIQVT